MSEITQRYAQVLCPHHGKVGLTPHEYHDQLMYSTEAWKCPTCGTISVFDYDYWNATHGEEEGSEA